MVQLKRHVGHGIGRSSQRVGAGENQTSRIAGVHPLLDGVLGASHLGVHVAGMSIGKTPVGHVVHTKVVGVDVRPAVVANLNLRTQRRVEVAGETAITGEDHVTHKWIGIAFIPFEKGSDGRPRCVVDGGRIDARLVGTLEPPRTEVWGAEMVGFVAVCVGDDKTLESVNIASGESIDLLDVVVVELKGRVDGNSDVARTSLGRQCAVILIQKCPRDVGALGLIGSLETDGAATILKGALDRIGLKDEARIEDPHRTIVHFAKDRRIAFVHNVRKRSAEEIIHIGTNDNVTIAIVAVVHKAIGRRKLHRLSRRAFVFTEHFKAHFGVGTQELLLTSTTGGSDMNIRRRGGAPANLVQQRRVGRRLQASNNGAREPVVHKDVVVQNRDERVSHLWVGWAHIIDELCLDVMIIRDGRDGVSEGFSGWPDVGSVRS
mmetsp:Transcript_22951/g.66225  ORF Transcript_22951/g.66225 Transcript_22951/m.66225 type:complete len:433 (+) Transcript_22951:4675-5973(+)